MSRCSSVTADDRRLSCRSMISKKANKDLELHGQIEDLLTALSGLQREHAAKLDELDAFKQEKDEERKLTKRLIELLGNGSHDEDDSINEITELCDQIATRLEKEEPAVPIEVSKPTLVHPAEELQQAREQLAQEIQKSRNLANRLAEQDADVVRLKSQLLDTRGKWKDIQKENQQLQKTISLLRQRNSSSDKTPGSPESADKGGLRELRLGRNSSTRSPQSSFSKRSSSLGMQALLSSTEQQAPAPEDALLLELVAAKTAEAVAKQDAEEAKAKLEALRKVLAGTATAVNNPPLSPGFSFLSSSASSTSSTTSGTSSNSGGSWFTGGWGKKAPTIDSR